jgi:ubiquinone biosynthesis protein UbiJ
MSTINPTMHTAAVAALETAANQALALDPVARHKLAELSGHSFKISCTAPKLDIVMLPGSDGLQFFGHYDGPVTTTITGEASDFTRLLAATDPAGELINGRLELQGNSGPLIELQKILASLELDWEAPLVSNLGDVAGHQLAEVMRGLFGWGQQAGRSLNRQMDEFIHEEARIAPPRLEVEDFYQDLGQLRQQVDRVAARLQRLQRRVANLHSGRQSPT